MLASLSLCPTLLDSCRSSAHLFSQNGHAFANVLPGGKERSEEINMFPHTGLDELASAKELAKFTLCVCVRRWSVTAHDDSISISMHSLLQSMPLSL